MDRPCSSNKQIRLWSALAVAVSMVVFGELPGNSLYWREVQNSAHTFVFAVVAVLILRLLQNSAADFRRASFKLYVVAGLISLMVGVLTEVVQRLIDSDSSTTDVMRDLTGIIAGLGLFASMNKSLQPPWLKSRRSVKAGIAVLSMAVFAASLLPLAHLSAAYVQRKQAFPVIFDLKAKWTAAFIQTKNAMFVTAVDQQANTAINTKGLTQVQFNAGIYPGISMIEPYPDWSLFEVLTLEIYSEQAGTFDLVIRIHDEKHTHAYSDRFSKSLKVNPGENHFRIALHDIKHAPVGREMDMTQISEIILFADKPAAPISFYLAAIRLE